MSTVSLRRSGKDPKDSSCNIMLDGFSKCASQAGWFDKRAGIVCAATLDGLLLRVVPAVIYSIPFYPMIGFQRDAAHVALFFCVLAVFSATVGALSMAITVGFGTAGKAALIMNLVCCTYFPLTPPSQFCLGTA